MATIEEDYVSFETAKLLKEKGFNEKCRSAYTNYGKLFTTQIQQYITNVLCSKGTLWDCTAPTLQMAMKWLRETKDWYIVLTPMFANDINHKMVLYGYDWEISSPSREQTEHSKDFSPNYEQACEAAIKYCLENLI